MSDDTKALVERLRAARVRVCDLASGAREWTMRIPADHSDDDDLILGTALVEAAATIERLERELAEARRDARRYRWLRDNPWHGELYWVVANHANAKWDAAIAAAMGESDGR